MNPNRAMRMGTREGKRESRSGSVEVEQVEPSIWDVEYGDMEHRIMEMGMRMEVWRRGVRSSDFIFFHF